ncbi:NADH:ubiquinone oxidoreductase subunit 3 [Orobanche minor]
MSAALSRLKQPVHFPARNGSNGRGLSICLQCRQPGESWLSEDRLRQGLLDLLLMRLGEGIGKGLINRAFGHTEKGKWIEGASQLELGVGAAQEAEEAPIHPDPDQEEEERAALLLEVRALILNQLQSESKKAAGVELSVLFPEMQEVDSSAAESIMHYDLEISRETDAESLREWVEQIRDDPNLLKPLIKDYLPKRRSNRTKCAVVMSEFSPILIYLVISPLVSLIPLGLPFLFSSNSSTYPEKLSAYECGFDPSGDARSRFDIRFYLVSILFIIPDPEVTFSFPWAVPPNKIDPFGSWSMMAFLLILTIGSLYEWKRGASDRE